MDSGERRYFRDAESLYGALLNILADINPGPQEKKGDLNDEMNIERA